MNSYSCKFRDLCLQTHLNETSSAAIRKHNRAMKKILALENEIESLEDKSFMLELLDDSDPRVKAISASFCVRKSLYVSKAFEVLDTINKSLRNYPRGVRDQVFHTLFIYRKEYEEYLAEMKKQ